MAKTYEPIASTTLSADSASHTFSAIPGDYTDLVIVVSANKDTSGSPAGLRMRFNGDTGSNYSTTLIFGDGSSAGSSRTTSATEMQVGNTAASTDSPATSVIQVMSYANTSVYKTTLNAGALASTAAARNVSLWRSTSAVTSVTFFSSADNLKSGSTFSLYGIKAA